VCDLWHGGGVVFDNPGDQLGVCALTFVLYGMEVEPFEVQITVGNTTAF
jgi:hypothetical protein